MVKEKNLENWTSISTKAKSKCPNHNWIFLLMGISLIERCSCEYIDFAIIFVNLLITEKDQKASKWALTVVWMWHTYIINTYKTIKIINRDKRAKEDSQMKAEYIRYDFMHIKLKDRNWKIALLYKARNKKKTSYMLWYKEWWS
jgi:hypothetical protein